MSDLGHFLTKAEYTVHMLQDVTSQLNFSYNTSLGSKSAHPHECLIFKLDFIWFDLPVNLSALVAIMCLYRTLLIKPFDQVL